MATTYAFEGNLLANAAGQLIGAMGADGREYLIPSVINAGASSTPPAAIYNSSVNFTGGTMNGVTIGGTTRAAANVTSINITGTDQSGTPGNVNNSGNAIGRAAFAAAANTVVVTDANCVPSSNIFIQVLGTDATLTTARVTAGTGSFTVTGNAAATAITSFNYLRINA
jgi:hypothetical protein